MKKLIFAALATGLIAVPGISQNRPDPACRREIIQLCGMTRDRAAIRACLQDKFTSLSRDCLSKLAEARKGSSAAANRVTGGAEYSFGNDAKQKLDFWPAPAGTIRPALVVFIHGGGWSIGDKATGTAEKPAHFNGLGYSFASINYRLVPTVKPDDQARDIASAIAWLRAQADKLGFDPNRIILSGHSAGAHLAALVSSDTGYLKTAGVPVAAIKGTILLDGAGYDVPRQIADGAGPMLNSMYEDAFGADRESQLRLSPIAHTGSPNVGNWLLLYVDARKDSKMQSEDLAEALRLSGAKANAVGITNSSHMKLNKDLGVTGDRATALVDAFIKSAL